MRESVEFAHIKPTSSMPRSITVDVLAKRRKRSLFTFLLIMEHYGLHHMGGVLLRFLGLYVWA